MNLCSWTNIFSDRADCSRLLPWECPYQLTTTEKSLITSSIQQFQLGEGSDGSGLLRRGRASALCALDGDFLSSLKLFIVEEQRHSRHLAMFMARQNIPCQSRHWVDNVFRRVRKLAGLELCLHVLVTAEIVAVPYYTALARATASPLLKAICSQVLRDEAGHLEYQAENLARLRSLRQPRGRGAEVLLWRTFMLATLQVVWWHHGKVLRAGGCTYSDFTSQCLQLLHNVTSCRHLNRPQKQAMRDPAWSKAVR